MQQYLFFQTFLYLVQESVIDLEGIKMKKNIMMACGHYQDVELPDDENKAKLQQHKIEEFSALQTIQLQPELVAYRVLQPNQNIAEYFDSRSGQLITDGEQQDAKRLAIWYTGLAKQQIVSTELITEFSDDYPSVNRLLPVWRVSFENGLRAYVDPSQSRLATLSNDQKMWMAKIK